MHRVRLVGVRVAFIEGEGVGRKVEVFTSGCELCRETVKMMSEVKCEECTLIEYNLSEEPGKEVYLQKAKDYGVKATPTIVVNGKIALVGKPTIEKVKEVLGV